MSLKGYKIAKNRPNETKNRNSPEFLFQMLIQKQGISDSLLSSLFIPVKKYFMCFRM